MNVQYSPQGSMSLFKRKRICIPPLIISLHPILESCFFLICFFLRQKAKQSQRQMHKPRKREHALTEGRQGSSSVRHCHVKETPTNPNMDNLPDPASQGPPPPDPLPDCQGQLLQRASLPNYVSFSNSTQYVNCPSYTRHT